MNKKIYITFLLFIIILMFTYNVVKADAFLTLSEFKSYVLNGENGYLHVDKNDENYEKQLKSLETYLLGATKNRDGYYVIEVNMTDGTTQRVGTLTEADWKSAKNWVKDGCPDESVQPNEEDGKYYEDSIQYQKIQIYNDVNNMIGALYSSSIQDDELDYNKYIESLKKQLEAVKTDNEYTGELQEYRISLYQKEINKTESLSSVKDRFETESEGMTREDIDKKLKTLNSNLQRYKNMQSGYMEDGKSRDTLIAETEAMIELYEEKRSKMVINSDNIYKYPKNNGGSTSSSLDDMIGDADSFLSKADRDVITEGSLQSFSQTLYNILLTVGIITAVLVGLVIGIRFMIGGAEEKANIKELLVPYVVGCIVVFGAFAIWKIVVTILSTI